jgi:hypothetical protein
MTAGHPQLREGSMWPLRLFSTIERMELINSIQLKGLNKQFKYKILLKTQK